MATKPTLKEASQTLQSSLTKFKTAQEGGTMTPEEVKESVEPIVEMALSIAEIGSEIQENVPADTTGAPTDITNDENNSTQESIHGEEDELQTRFSQMEKTSKQLQSQIDELNEDKEKEKLAQKYAQLYPEPMREAKMKEFMSREGNMSVLEGQLKEAESNLGGLKAIKQAQQEEGIFELPEYDGNTTNSIHYGGKC